MNKSMIVGNPTKSLIMFAVPIILGQLCQQVYSLADTIIVGRTLGQGPLGAVGSAVSVCWVFVAIAIGLGMGCSVVISQLFGANKIGKMKTAISTSLISMIALSIIFLIIGIIFCDAITALMNTPAELVEDAKTYFWIYVVGFPGLFLYNICNSIFNGLGKSKYPLIFLASSAVLNIGLDLWFILGLHWGVAGAAIATIVSQYISAVLCFITLLKYLKKDCATDEESTLYDFSMLKVIAKVAIPTMITQTIMSVGLVALQGLINSFGTDIMAGYTAASKIDGLAIIPMVQIGNAASTFAAQNVGAGQYDRVVKGYHTALVMNLIVCIAVTGALLIWSAQAIGLFMDASSSATAIAKGVEYIQIVSIFYIVMGLGNCTLGILRGTGDIKPTMVSLFANFGSKVAFAYIFATIFHSELFVWWSVPIGWALGFIIAYARFKTGKWRTKSVVREIN